jgi:hypothetical protein
MGEVANFLYHDLESVEHGKKPTTIELKNICDPKSPFADYPCLRYLKAAEVRALVPSVYNLCVQYNDQTRTMKHIINLLKNLKTMYDIMHMSDITVRRDDYIKFKAAARIFLLTYSFLAKSAADDNKYLWSVVPKFHYCYHMVQQMEFTNCRYVWCYGGEDLVGRKSHLAHSCVRGLPASKMSVKLFEKYTIASHLRYTR